MVKQREIYTVVWPFTDLTSHKERPAVVLSNDTINTSMRDYIMVSMTSNINTPNPYTIRIGPMDLEPGGHLPKLSEIRINIIFTANRDLLRGFVGTLRPQVFENMKKELLKII